MIKTFFIFLMIITILKANNDRVVGGFEKKSGHQECETALKIILNEHPGFQDYSVKSCETQLVNGINYRMILVHPDKVVKKCKITIYQSFDKNNTSPLKYREKENDCFTMFDNAKQSTTTV